MPESDDNMYQGYNIDVEGEVQNLARTMSRSNSFYTKDKSSLSRSLTNMSSCPGCNPMQGEIDARLDPNSPSFSSAFWIKNLQKLTYSDSDYYKPSSLGFAYKNLRTYGEAADASYQATFGNSIYKAIFQRVTQVVKKNNTEAQQDILKPMDGLIVPGKITVVLGRPGAGCTTFLKTVAAQTHGFHVDKESQISYDGISFSDITKKFRGEVVYCAETENHFPNLTVGDTLRFAARMRTPRNRPPRVTREQYAEHMADIAMATFGLSHTKNTKVGNDYIRGVSGGERKRVSIAEVYLAQSKLQCWDNSTRGLDSATALEFVRALKTSATISNTTPLVAIYQCSQDAYDLFDKVVLLYEGYQIFNGDANTAKEFFINMGYECPPRQTTADFLSSLTNPSEREVRRGFEEKVPRSPREFYDYWQNSPERKQLLVEIDAYFASSNSKRQEFADSCLARHSKRSREGSPYTVSFLMQVKYVMGRNFLRIKGDPGLTIFAIFGNCVLSLILSTVFKGLKDSTADFYARTAVLFFAVLFNAFSSLLEIFSLYEARAIVEKHKTFAFYHPSADACASIMTEMPSKIIICIVFNLILYFMVDLRRAPGYFFYYLLMNFSATLAMSHLFRTIGAATKSIAQAMSPAALLLLILSIFTGFVIPPQMMHGWCRWINYIDPIAYIFEGLIANEFHGRDFECSSYIPNGPGYSQYQATINSICSVKGSEPGSTVVNGDAYIAVSYQYYNSHKWRNFGIAVAYIVVFFFVYLVLVEFNKGAMQKGEILVFQSAKLARKKQSGDIEGGGVSEKVTVKEQLESDCQMSLCDFSNKAVFHWKNLSYEVPIKKEKRVILNDISGWVKPGQVTALMGASGAGKTTLLNALSDRLTSGAITNGTRMVNGHALDSSFQRSIGYVQQQDLHLETSTVREALRFSAYLRQSASASKAEKNAYVEEIIDLLDMRAYSDAVVGVAGEGLNVEQRKRLTIGVELVAKPKLLIFLDEPTSGLDSQTAWSICKLIRKLADHGQSILCTIHQPSAILMKEFDRLLFLQKGGQTIYFGDLGENSQTLIDYFESYGAPKCPPQANPAEWMLEVIGAAPGSHADKDYHEVWKNSKEYHKVMEELETIERELLKLPEDEDPEKFKSFAAPLHEQYYQATKRVFEQSWRSPSYTYNKFFMTIVSTLFNGFVFFKADKSLQGLQNQMFSVFMFLVVFNTLIQQYLPFFVKQRSIYEVRERPSKTFSWVAFIAAQITAEIPWNIACGTIGFFCWYYPVGLYANASPTNSVASRGATMWFAIVLFFVYSSTMGQLCISFIELADTAANLASLLFTMCLMFCGVLQSKDALPRFWIFMYRCNPFTYLVSAILSVGLANSSVSCSVDELLSVIPPDGMSCSSYLNNYINAYGGYLVDSTSSACKFCPVAYTNTFLAQVSADYSTRWRDIAILICFIIINMIGTVLFYYLARVPKKAHKK